MTTDICSEYNGKHLEVSIKGNFEVNDYITLLQSIGQRTDLPEHLKVIVFDNGTQINIMQNDVALIEASKDKFVAQFTNVRQALVTQNPKMTALAYISIYANKNPNYKTSVFSTKEAALEWLLI